MDPKQIRIKCFLERAHALEDIRVVYAPRTLTSAQLLGLLEREYGVSMLRITAFQTAASGERIAAVDRLKSSLEAWDEVRGSSETLKLWLARGDTSSGARTPPLVAVLDDDPGPVAAGVPFVALKSSLGELSLSAETHHSAGSHRVHAFTPPLSPVHSDAEGPDGSDGALAGGDDGDDGGDDDDDAVSSASTSTVRTRSIASSLESINRAASPLLQPAQPLPIRVPSGVGVQQRPRTRSFSDGGDRHRTPPQSPPHSPPRSRHNPHDSTDSSTTAQSPTSPHTAFQWGRLMIAPDAAQPAAVEKAKLTIRPEPRFDLIDSSSDHLTMSGQHMTEIGFERSEKALGAGAFGKVWLGLRDNGEFLAIKEIQIAPNEKYAQRLEAVENEIELMRSLDHPHIVRYLGSKRDVARGAFYILLEYVSCGSIQALLKTMGGPLDERVIRKYARQILLGLAYLHSREPPVAHRDIKSANVLVETTGNVKLADFGCSKVFSDLLEGSREYTSVLGTPHWMAPEVIRQDGAGLAADIWSFGCTVLEMATGQPPWAHIRDPTAVMFHIASSNDPPQLPDSLSDDGHDFLRRCFQRDPLKRPTAAELLQHAFVSSEHVGGSSQREVLDSEARLNSLMISQSLTTMPQFLSVLPANLVIYIFQFLSVTDLCSVSAVCRQWRAAAATDALWKVKAQQQWPWLDSAKGARWRDAYVQGNARTGWRRRPLTLDTLRGHGKAVLCVEARGSDRLVTGGEDKKIRIWSIAKRKCVLTLKGHTKAVTALRSDDARVVSGGADAVVRLWDAAKGKLLRGLEGHRGSVTGVDLAAPTAVSCASDGLRVWDVETGICTTAALPSYAANAVRLDAAATRALVACQDGTLRMWDVRSGRGSAEAMLAGHADSVTCVQWGRSADLVVSCSMDATVRLWDARAMRAYSTLRATGFDGPLFSVDLDASVLAAGGRDRVLHVWDVASEELLRQFKQHHSDTIHGVAVGADQRIVTCSRDKTVRVLRQDTTEQGKRNTGRALSFLRLGEMFSSAAAPAADDKSE